VCSQLDVLLNANTRTPLLRQQHVHARIVHQLYMNPQILACVFPDTAPLHVSEVIQKEEVI
jgi:hypothetical protein